MDEKILKYSYDALHISFLANIVVLQQFLVQKFQVGISEQRNFSNLFPERLKNKTSLAPIDMCDALLGN